MMGLTGLIQSELNEGRKTTDKRGVCLGVRQRGAQHRFSSPLLRTVPCKERTPDELSYCLGTPSVPPAPHDAGAFYGDKPRRCTAAEKTLGFDVKQQREALRS